MPMHDWTRVSAGTYHAFHNAWFTHLQEQLNGGVLPPSYYALGERQAGDMRLSVEALSEAGFYRQRRRTLVIRHATGDRVVALLEIVSPANKHSADDVDQFCDKVLSALERGIHVLVVDPFPGRRHDEHGMHGVIWQRLSGDVYIPPTDKPLTLASYCAKTPVMAYVEPVCVGEALARMPLFAKKTHYVYVPLEDTYMQAWKGVPQRWRRVIEAVAEPTTG
jgi:hypothetical protein